LIVSVLAQETNGTECDIGERFEIDIGRIHSKKSSSRITDIPAVTVTSARRDRRAPYQSRSAEMTGSL
jgi:hypothetical protein